MSIAFTQKHFQRYKIDLRDTHPAVKDAIVTLIWCFRCMDVVLPDEIIDAICILYLEGLNLYGQCPLRWAKSMRKTIPDLASLELGGPAGPMHMFDPSPIAFWPSKLHLYGAAGPLRNTHRSLICLSQGRDISTWTWEDENAHEDRCIKIEAARCDAIAREDDNAYLYRPNSSPYKMSSFKFGRIYVCFHTDSFNGYVPCEDITESQYV